MDLKCYYLFVLPALPMGLIKMTLWSICAQTPRPSSRVYILLKSSANVHRTIGWRILLVSSVWVWPPRKLSVLTRASYAWSEISPNSYDLHSGCDHRMVAVYDNRVVCSSCFRLERQLLKKDVCWLALLFSIISIIHKLDPLSFSIRRSCWGVHNLFFWHLLSKDTYRFR